MVKEQLLKCVGEFMYGEQWQAPLARDLSVNERSMRRWVADAGSIPQGVWDALVVRLESMVADLQYLITEVKSATDTVQGTVSTA